MKKFEHPPLQIEPTASRRLCILFLFVHLTALVATAVSVDRLMPVVLISLVVSANLLYQWRRRPELNGCRTVHRWERNGSWWWSEEGREEELMRLLPAPFVTPQLLVVRMESLDGRDRRSLLLTPDAIGSESHRKMRVRLRLEGGREKRRTLLH